MKKKLIGSYYPRCNSTQTRYTKRSSFDGEFIIKDGNLVFNRTVLMLVRTEAKSVSIPLNNIEKVETFQLNGFMPFGVCVFTKDGEEYMFGHIHNKRLKEFILNAKEGFIEEYTTADKMKSNVKKVIVSIIIILLLLLTFVVVQELNIENIVRKEVEKISNLDYNKEQVDMKIYSKNDYGKVEKAIKEYYKEFYQYKKEYYDYYAPTSYGVIFDNYNSNLNDMLEIIKTNKIKTQEASEKLLELLNDEKSLSYINSYSLDDYYIDFYKEQIEYNSNKKYMDEWKDTINKDNKKFDYLIDMANSLISHPDSWYVQEDTIYFNDDDLLKKFNDNYDLLYEDM